MCSFDMQGNLVCFTIMVPTVRNFRLGTFPARFSYSKKTKEKQRTLRPLPNGSTALFR
jgi:hypothetical protein